MKAICSFILALAVSSAGAQIRPVESLPIAVNYSKTIHLVFPSAVKYNQAVTDFVAVDNPESVPNILRIKANRKSFSKQTTVSVATEGGFSIRLTWPMPTAWSIRTISCPICRAYGRTLSI